ncbi:MAG: hypothetical protein LBI17_01250 [Rickettsiales bacterium]|jgi:hypothetical protein|nr:hypothetical protein [Rickettsiales bacterium]
MAKKSGALDAVRQLCCWLEIGLFLAAVLMPASSFRLYTVIAIIVIAILQFMAFRHF